MPSFPQIFGRVDLLGKFGKFCVNLTYCGFVGLRWGRNWGWRARFWPDFGYFGDFSDIFADISECHSKEGFWEVFPDFSDFGRFGVEIEFWVDFCCGCVSGGGENELWCKTHVNPHVIWVNHAGIMDADGRNEVIPSEVVVSSRLRWDRNVLKSTIFCEKIEFSVFSQSVNFFPWTVRFRSTSAKSGEKSSISVNNLCGTGWLGDW